MKVFIMRGIPGSGKSTWVKQYIQPLEIGSYLICSADFFHTRPNGVYDYQPSKAGEAHRKCLKDFSESLHSRGRIFCKYLFVDNTNTTLLEIAPYYRLAEVYGAEIEIIQIDCPLQLALSRNTHKVPEATVWAMYQNILTEKLPRDWKLKIVPAYGTTITKSELDLVRGVSF